MSSYRASQAGKRHLGDTTAMTASHLPQSEAAHRMDLRSEVGPVVISYCKSDLSQLALLSAAASTSAKTESFTLRMDRS
jgi:hypothetical protein